jgi:predicted nucleotidyltransferase
VPYTSQSILYSIRGGDDGDDETDLSDFDDYQESDEEEKEIEEEIEKLSASAKKVIEKSKEKKKAKVKQTVSESLSRSKSKKKKGSGTSVLKKIPYIVRAFMNPFTVFAMTKGYFASLFNIDYLQEVSLSFCLFLIYL